MTDINKNDSSIDPQARRHRLFNVLIIGPAILAILTFVIIYLVYPKEYLFESYVYRRALLVSVVLIVITVSVLLMRYLQTGKIFRQPDEKSIIDQFSISSIQHKINQRFAAQQDQLQSLRDSYEKIVSDLSKPGKLHADIDEKQKEEIIDNLKKRFASAAGDEFIDDLKSKVALNMEQTSVLNTIDERCTETVERLSKEVSALSRRGNLNLVLGIVTTITGLIVLYVYVSKIVVDPSTPWLMAANFLPRLSLVLFIELFAYFFLKLYKSNLSEIKYFQNELTNIEAKYLSLRTALLNNDESLISEVIKSLSKTERNFILQKGQSTVELEQTKMDKEAVSGIVSTITDAVKKININK